MERFVWRYYLTGWPRNFVARHDGSSWLWFKSFLCFLFRCSSSPTVVLGLACPPKPWRRGVEDPGPWVLGSSPIMTTGPLEWQRRKICPLFFGIWYTLRLRTRKFLLKEGLSRLIPLAAGCSAARNILAVYLASDPFLYNRSGSFDPADAVQRRVVNESDFRGALFPVQDPKIVKKIRTKKRILCGSWFLASRSKGQRCAV